MGDPKTWYQEYMRRKVAPKIQAGARWICFFVCWALFAQIIWLFTTGVLWGLLGIPPAIFASAAFGAWMQGWKVNASWDNED